MSRSSNDHSGGLRAVIEAACDEQGSQLNAMTVLSSQNDPFRVDTPSGHRDGHWLAMEAGRLGLGDRIIHLRGLHYMLVSGESIKPNGLPYTNTDPDWAWLQNSAAKAARWLRYIPFGQIKDARNSEPSIHRFERPVPHAYVSVGVDVEIPDADDLDLEIDVDGYEGVQPYKLVIYGEKTSLEEVLIPIANSRRADLYLPAGEISDTLMHKIASVGAEDGRPMVVITVSDCDPSGWQMPISIGRKLQALQALEFPDLEFEVHRVALTPDQVREHGLPSTPLKPTEKRADKWTAAMGVAQTEIDALAALQPALLDRIVRQAIEPFYDSTLDARVWDAREEWLREAQTRLDAQLDQEQRGWIRLEAAEKLDVLREEIDAINNALHVNVDDLTLPDIVVPEPELSGHTSRPLIDSRWGWVEQTVSLKRSKAYTDDDVD